MNIKHARKIVKAIKEIDTVLWGLKRGEIREKLNDTRYNLWVVLENSGWNFNTDYKLYSVITKQ